MHIADPCVLLASYSNWARIPARFRHQWQVSAVWQVHRRPIAIPSFLPGAWWNSLQSLKSLSRFPRRSDRVASNRRAGRLNLSERPTVGLFEGTPVPHNIDLNISAPLL